MSLRNKLLASFTAISFTILILCGLLSYRIAQEIDETKEGELTLTLTLDAATLLAPLLQSGTFDSNVIDRTCSTFTSNTKHIIISHSGEIIYHHLNDAHLSELVRDDLETFAPTGETERIGHIDRGDYHLSFATIPLEGSPYFLTLVRRLSDHETHAMRAIVVRLLITGMVIMWIAIWAALVLSSWIAKRLNIQNEAILYQALHDDLTGMSNRASLFRDMKETIQGIRKRKKKMALFVLDLDRFKEINDTLGHGYGDELLVKIANRLEDFSEDCHTIARMGGDEFAILKIMEDVGEASTFAGEISACFDKLIMVKEFALHVRSSMGIALYPLHGKDAETLIRRAEVAMYKAKEDKSGWAIYSADDDPFSVRRLTLLGELKRAIEENQLVLHYQPKLTLGSGNVESVEALLRWQHPKLGLVPPDEFIGIAEQSGLIKPLTIWVIRQALRDLKLWEAGGLTLSVAINISTHLFYDFRFPTELAALLQELQISPQRIELEITESLLMENLQNTMEVLKRLDDMGHSLSIDDFGTGFSSLAYLKRFPVDYLKIDKSFVLDMETSENDRSIVNAIVDLAHDLNFRVIAEGIENERVLTMLKEMNCDVAQGFYLSRPVPADDFMEWMKNRGLMNKDSTS